MKIFDPIIGGRIRALLTFLSLTFATVAPIAGFTEHVWYQVTIAVLTCWVGFVQGITHLTDAGNVDLMDGGD